MSKLSRPKTIKLQKPKINDNIVTIKKSEYDTVGTLTGPISLEKYEFNDHSKIDEYESSPKDKKIQTLLNMLNWSQTGCKFWDPWNPYEDIEEGDLQGIRPVKRFTIEKLEENIFSPTERKTEETFFRFYILDIVESDDKYTYNEDDYKKERKLVEKGFI